MTTDAIELLRDREQAAALADLLELRDIFALDEIAAEDQAKLGD
ncbi:MAG TPA: hypothetical protein VNK95_17150 [Caldilineaceae bacterium]|nr:hypothetical protein [Caldilineaceae bacterium]